MINMEYQTPPPITVTYSALGKFSACRRMWWFSEYLKLRKKAEPRTGPLPFGTRIHTALELWGKGKVEAPVDIWDALNAPEYVWTEAQGYSTDDLDKEVKLGFAMLSGFPDWLAASGHYAKFETVAVEHVMKDYLDITLLQGQQVRVLMQGKADQIVRRKSDGTHLILDFKTTSQLADTVLTVLAKSPQIRNYALLAKKEHPELTFSGGILLLLRKVQQTKETKVPFYAELEIPISKSDMQAYVVRLKAVIMDLVNVQTALDFGTNPDLVAYFTPNRVNCMSCPFRQPCDMMASFPQGAADMLKNEYEGHNPLERYDQNGELDV
jgi:hypothetical protein